MFANISPQKFCHLCLSYMLCNGVRAREEGHTVGLGAYILFRLDRSSPKTKLEDGHRPCHRDYNSLVATTTCEHLNLEKKLRNSICILLHGLPPGKNNKGIHFPLIALDILQFKKPYSVWWSVLFISWLLHIRMNCASVWIIKRIYMLRRATHNISFNDMSSKWKELDLEQQTIFRIIPYSHGVRCRRCFILNWFGDAGVHLSNEYVEAWKWMKKHGGGSEANGYLLK